MNYIGVMIVLSLVVLDDSPTYERDVKPLLAKRCNVCHNANKIGQEDISGGLALDSYEAAIRGTKDHAIILSGKSTSSELFTRLTDNDEDRRMPLSDKPLAEREVNLVRRWIDAGAPRGEAVVSATDATGVSRTRRRPARSVDVVIPLEVKVPSGKNGFGAGGPMRLSLKVGPLPSVTALAFRGDGRLLAVGTYGMVVLWDVIDGRPANVLGDIPGPVHALAFTRDGRRLAVGSGLPARTGSVRVYDVPGGTLLRDFTGHGDVVFGLAFRPDDGQLASASFDQTVRFWDLIRGRPAGVFRGHSDFVLDVAYDRDGKTVLSASRDRSIKRIDVAKVKELRTYSEHNEGVLSLAIPPSGGQFVSVGEEPQLRWWKSDAERSSKKVGGHSGPVHQIAFSADGSKMISAGGDGTVRLWNGRDGSPLKSLPGSTDWQYAAALSADGMLAAAGGWNGVVRLWDADKGTLRASLLQPPSDETGLSEWLAVCPSGYYSSSPGLSDLLRWNVGDQAVDSALTRSLFDRPGELSQALRGEMVPSPLR